MNAIIYARVSTDEHAEKGYSLKSQIKECREFTIANGLSLVTKITDEYSGSTPDRPGFYQVK